MTAVISWLSYGRDRKSSESIREEWPDYEPYDDGRECVHGDHAECQDLICLALQNTSILTWIEGRKQFGEEVSAMLRELGEASANG